jgi:hypothetical protein
MCFTNPSWIDDVTIYFRCPPPPLFYSSTVWTAFKGQSKLQILQRAWLSHFYPELFIYTYTYVYIKREREGERAYVKVTFLVAAPFIMHYEI